jgi:hypothetical protein
MHRTWSIGFAMLALVAAGATAATPARSAPSAPLVVLYDQFNNAVTAGAVSSPSTNYPAPSDAWDTHTADDFVVPAGQTWTITSVDVMGTGSGANPPDSFNLTFYNNGAGNLPGSVSATQALRPWTNIAANPNDYAITLSPSVVLGAGTYWVAVQANMSTVNPPTFWGWQYRSVQSNNGAAWQNPGNAWGTGCTTWTRRTSCFGTPPDHVFRLNGAGPTAAGLLSVAAARAPAGIGISWRVGSETGVLGYDVLRQVARGGWERANARLIPARGRPGTYRFVDRSARSGGRYAVETVRLDGTSVRSAAVRALRR